MKKYLSKVCILVSFLCTSLSLADESIAILGTGYVGLVLGAGLAECGHKVICCDIDESKITRLNKGIMPIFEPGLEEVVQKNFENERLFFSNNINEAIQNSDIIFIAVGTPTGADGCTDITALEKAFDTIVRLSETPKIVCIKSTVPIGTGKSFSRVIASHKKEHILSLASNPEFLREGSAVYDFFNPDRIVIGSNNTTVAERIKNIFQPIITPEVRVITTDITTSETIKYAANAFLANKISFVNEIANLCDETGACMADVELGLGTDPRIGPHFLKPGPGFGGSCFPKDTTALVTLAQTHGVQLKTVKAAIETNEHQKRKALIVAKDMVGTLKDKTVAILGLSFKANTDDIREAASLIIIDELIKAGALVKAYDPMAMEHTKKIFSDIVYCSSALGAIDGADVLIVLTEWPEFKQLNIKEICSLMNDSNIIDMRNIFNKDALATYAKRCYVVGCGTKLRNEPYDQ